MSAVKKPTRSDVIARAAKIFIEISLEYLCRRKMRMIPKNGRRRSEAQKAKRS
jgi:hypothetical protein